MLERAIEVIGCGLAFVGLISGIIFRAEGLTIAVIGLIMMMFGMWFDED